MVTWISKDKSSPNYGKEVTVNDSGKIVAASSVITVSTNKSGQTTYTTPKTSSNPKGTTTNEAQAVNETLMNNGVTNVRPLQTQANQDLGQSALDLVGLKKPNITPTMASANDYIIFGAKVSPAVAVKLYSETQGLTTFKTTPEGIITTLPEKPKNAVTLTLKGPVYTETGQTINSAFEQQNKENAFGFLAPAEKFIAGMGGSKEIVYEKVVKPKLAMESAILRSEQIFQKKSNYGQVGAYLSNPSERLKQTGNEFKAGAFGMLTSPVETAAMIVGFQMLPVAAEADLMGSYATGIGLTSGIGIARNPQDPFSGIARTTGEASVLVAGSSGLNLVGGKMIPRVGIEEVKFVSKSTGEDVTLYKGIKLGEQPLIGASGKKVVIGTPKVDFSKVDMKDLTFEGFNPATRTQYQYAQKALDVVGAPGKAEEAAMIVKGIKTTELTRSPINRPQVAETKSLGPRSVKEVDIFARQNRVLQYGSRPAESLMPEGMLAKGRGLKPGELAIQDQDLQFNLDTYATTNKANKLLGKISATGEQPVSINEKTPMLIESVKNGKSGHAVDIHSNDMALEGQTAEGIAGFRFERNPTVKNILTGENKMSLAEFRTRKAASVLTLRETPEGLSFGPEPHRLKDWADLQTSQNFLTDVKYGKGKGNLNLPEAKLKDISMSGESGGFVPRSSLSISPFVASSPSISLFSQSSSSLSPSRSQSISPSKSLSLSPSFSLSSPSSPSKSNSLSLSISPSISPSRPSSPSPSSPSISKGSGSGSPYPSRPSPRISVGSGDIIVPPLPPKFPNLYPPSSQRSPHKKGTKEKKFYTPSLSAELAGLSAKGGQRRGFTGLEIRPMIESKSRNYMPLSAGKEPKHKELKMSTRRRL